MRLPTLEAPKQILHEASLSIVPTGPQRIVRNAMQLPRAAQRVLHASVELFPLVKTGGLADVAAALPAALADQGVDVESTLPFYRTLRARLGELAPAGVFEVHGRRIEMFRVAHPDSGLPLTLVEADGLYDREGDPYHDVDGRPFQDNALRFGVFCEAIATIAAGLAPGIPGFDLAHLHDWQTGLAALHLKRRAPQVASVFTIHNLAYQGLFSRAEFDALGLDPTLWRADAIEAVGCLSFIKAGLTYADAITTVSPHYAREIQTEAFGEGLHELLRARADSLHGILNGIDTQLWDPARDPHLAQRYDATGVLQGKASNKLVLQRELGLPQQPLPMLAFIGRLAHQKGADALLAAADRLAALPLQVVVLAAGDRELERSFAEWEKRSPQQVALCLRYDEALAHRIEAGADLQLMPSRYEPCGLTQMYSQRYGTVPLVRRVGGLIDSVSDAADPSGSGIWFEHTDAGGVIYAVERALELMRDPPRWSRLQQTGMARDFSWQAAAARYCRLYSQLRQRVPSEERTLDHC